MTGKELFEKYSKAAAGTEESEYFSTLCVALTSIGRERLFKALEEAESTGKKIVLIKPADAPDDAYIDDVDITLI